MLVSEKKGLPWWDAQLKEEELCAMLETLPFGALWAIATSRLSGLSGFAASQASEHSVSLHGKSLGVLYLEDIHKKVQARACASPC